MDEEEDLTIRNEHARVAAPLHMPKNVPTIDGSATQNPSPRSMFAELLSAK